MGHRYSREHYVNAHQKPRFTRDQRMTITNGILVLVVMIVIMQLWLLTASVNAGLGGDGSILWPAAFASAGCLILNLGLLRYLSKMG